MTDEVSGNPAGARETRLEERVAELLRALGFEVRVHPIRDVLPYPHVLYVCRRREPQGAFPTGATTSFPSSSASGGP
jgi:hypothetical protein